jgi:hypothetical protein
VANFHYRLLVIDDEPLNQELLASSLSAGIVQHEAHAGWRPYRAAGKGNDESADSPQTDNSTISYHGHARAHWLRRRVTISIFTPFSLTSITPNLRRIVYASREMLPLAFNREREIS